MDPESKTALSADVPPAVFCSRIGNFRYSGIYLLAALLLNIITAPFVENLLYGRLIEEIMATLVMGSAVLVTGNKGRILTVAIILVTLALVGKWLNYLAPSLIPQSVPLIAASTFFTFTVAQLLRFILHTPTVDANVLCAGLAGYLMLGMLWVPAYILTADLTPDAFIFTRTFEDGSSMKGFNAFYFSLVTLCTVGYGDIAPVSKVARMLVVMEAITGLFYMAVLISRLVAIYSTQHPVGQTGDSSANDDQ